MLNGLVFDSLRGYSNPCESTGIFMHKKRPPFLEAFGILWYKLKAVLRLQRSILSFLLLIQTQPHHLQQFGVQDLSRGRSTRCLNRCL
jgi:hypothetical protein